MGEAATGGQADPREGPKTPLREPRTGGWAQGGKPGGHRGMEAKPRKRGPEERLGGGRRSGKKNCRP